MSELRKAKAAARRAARKEKSFTAFEAKPIETPTVTPTIEKPRDIDNSQSLRLKDATPITTPNQATAIKTNSIAPVDTTTNDLVGTAKLESKLPQSAQQLNPTVTPDIQPRQITISDMLEGQRRKITQDKTDAAKMQKYYALADAMKALGQMGGTAIGGAIGGNALDSAPKVAEYKESRGYLDAFEKAKQANDRLRALDEKEFNLNYSKQLRDEDRAYKEKIAEKERKFRAEQAELERKWKTANAAERAKIEAAILASKQAHEKWLKERSLEYARIMMRGKGGSGEGSARTGSPFIFDDDSVLYMDKEDINALKNRYVNRKVGDMVIDESNFNEFIAQNPQIVSNYLKRIGKDAQFLTLEPDATQTTTQNTGTTNEKPKKKSFWERISLVGGASPDGNYVDMSGVLNPERTSYRVENDPMADLLSK